jgi:hypothetical protein
VNVIGSFLRIEGPMTARADDGTDFGRYVVALVNQHGFRIANHVLARSVDCGWEDCSSFNVYGDAYYVGGTNESSNVSNQDIHLDRCLGLYNGRQGIGVINVEGFDVTDVDIRKSGRSGYDSEPNGSRQRVWDVNLIRGLRLHVDEQQSHRLR